MNHLAVPYGGELVKLIADAENGVRLKDEARGLAAWTLQTRQLVELELLLSGAFSPLKGFMCQEEYESVCGSMRLGDGLFWPIPVALDVDEGFAKRIKPDTSIALCDQEGLALAVLRVEDIWKPNLQVEASSVFGISNTEHQGIHDFYINTFPFYIGGKIEGIQYPVHYDFINLRRGPAEIRANFERIGWRKIIAFQTTKYIHRAEQKFTSNAALRNKSNLLIQILSDPSQLEDLDYYARVKCCRMAQSHYPQDSTNINILPYISRNAGSKEALLKAIISKNYGCTHYILDPRQSEPDIECSYDLKNAVSRYEKIWREFEKDLDIVMIPFEELYYDEGQDQFVKEEDVSSAAKTISLSQKELIQRLENGRQIPEWFTFCETAEELRSIHPPKHKQGFTVFFTGLSGSGKSTIANNLLVKLLQMCGRPITLLDGDIVRKNLSSELGFSKEHRDLNIKRIGYVASEITKNKGIALCAPIAPYDSIRKEVRQNISSLGGFILVHLSTPLEECEKRDRKGLYAKARAGIIKEFTGISDPYEPPEDAELVIDTTNISAEEAVSEIILYLEQQGYIGADVR